MKQLHPEPVQRCRFCGCTNDNACLDEWGGACCWVADDVCSACQPESSPRTANALLLLVVLAATTLLAACSSPPPPPAVGLTAATDNRAAETSARNRRNGTVRLHLLEHAGSVGTDYAVVTGRVRNISGVPMETVEARVSWFDSAGEFVTDDDALLDAAGGRGDLAIGQTSSFSVLTRTRGGRRDLASYRIDFETFGTRDGRILHREDR